MDNTELDPGSGGDKIRDEDVGGGVKIPVSKWYTGEHGVDGGPVTETNPGPVRITNGVAFIDSPEHDQFPASLGPKHMAASLSVTLADDQAEIPVAVTFPATTDVSDRSARVLGHVVIDGAPSVTVTNLPGTQPVSAASLPLPTGASTASAQAGQQTTLDAILGKQTDGSQKVQVTNLPVTQPVSGPLTDGQLRASPVQVSATSLTLPAGAATEATLSVVQADVHSILTTQTSGAQKTQVTALPALPAGTSTIGKVDQGAGGASAWKVDGSAVTQPVSGPLTDTQLRATAVPVSDGGGSITVDGTVAVSNFPATQPVSGTVTANVGTTNGLALDATVGKRFTGGKNTSATTVNSNGDNSVYSPASGKTLTLFWVFLSSSQDNSAEVLATVKLGAKVVYKAYMGNPGAFSHWEPVTADNPNDALVINLSAGGNSVAVSYSTTEV